MSDLIGRIAARAVGAPALAQPRVAAPPLGTGGLEVVDEEVVAPIAASPVEPRHRRAGSRRPTARRGRDPARRACGFTDPDCRSSTGCGVPGAGGGGAPSPRAPPPGARARLGRPHRGEARPSARRAPGRRDRRPRAGGAGFSAGPPGGPSWGHGGPWVHTPRRAAARSRPHRPARGARQPPGAAEAGAAAAAGEPEGLSLSDYLQGKR